jgi:tRNA(adenine34) deaminase
MQHRLTGKERSKFFSLALGLARNAAKRNEIPIGAVLVKDGKIIARAYNSTEKLGTFTAHAEMLCITAACKKLHTKFLYDCELYVTLEPCKMCLAAARLSRIRKINFLAKSPKFGSRGLAYFKTIMSRSRSSMTQSAVELLQAFFKSRR